MLFQIILIIGEIRSVSHLNNDGLTVKPEIEESNIKLCEELIAKLKFEYSLDTFYDPKLRVSNKLMNKYKTGLVTLIIFRTCMQQLRH